MKDNYKFFQNRKCEYFPCHKIENEEEFNCIFCYCPLYALGKKCGGGFEILENGTKSCLNCRFPHIRENYDSVNSRFSEIVNLIKETEEQ